MSKNRMEAFSDGVIAIIITIMVLNLRAPASANLDALIALAPKFVSYMLSFVFLGIYWSNHHHLLQAVKHVDGRALWANLHLLFWLSLTPLVTEWIGESHFSSLSVALYGVLLLFSAVAYFILTKSLIALHGKDSVIATALGKDMKGKASIALYALAIFLSFVTPWLAFAVYILVAVIWLVPDKRIEKILLQ